MSVTRYTQSRTHISKKKFQFSIRPVFVIFFEGSNNNIYPLFQFLNDVYSNAWEGIQHGVLYSKALARKVRARYSFELLKSYGYRENPCNAIIFIFDVIHTIFDKLI